MLFESEQKQTVKRRRCGGDFEHTQCFSMNSTFGIASKLKKPIRSGWRRRSKHTINAGHQGKPPNLHQTISPGSYKSALASAASTDAVGLLFVGVRFGVVVVSLEST